MRLRAEVPLAPLTSFKMGGRAALFAQAEHEADVVAALAKARGHGLPLLALGGGTNLLVPDEGVEALVLKIALADVAFADEGDTVALSAGAGALWNDLVARATRRDLWGIELLAGIPGTAGGAVVQNIGAYGAELAEVFAYADAIDTARGTRVRISAKETTFGYRSSVFMRRRDLIIVRVCLRLAKRGVARLAYPDLMALSHTEASLATPNEVARAVRGIRARKFPNLRKEGTAGSFFKNPAVSQAQARALAAQYVGLPQYPQTDGRVKIPLAWLLDHAFGLKGFRAGGARLYERQPLVIVATPGASARDVEHLARAIEERVLRATGIELEREVTTFGVSLARAEHFDAAPSPVIHM